MKRGETLSMWTVYDRPKDYPTLFVARRSELRSLGKIATTEDLRLAETLDDVRAKLPPGLYRLDRMPGDDAKIVEVWL